MKITEAAAGVVEWINGQGYEPTAELTWLTLDSVPASEDISILVYATGLIEAGPNDRAGELTRLEVDVLVRRKVTSNGAKFDIDAISEVIDLAEQIKNEAYEGLTMSDGLTVESTRFNPLFDFDELYLNSIASSTVTLVIYY